MALYEDIKNARNYMGTKIEIPTYITANLKYSLFDWQRTALENFLFNEQTRKNKQGNGEVLPPNHLMFNMATGTGKTLLMAALLLYYYKNGYRNFIFFVSQNNIVGKTQDNFLNKSHGKYLFVPQISIDGMNVNIREVETFSNFSYDIQMKFTTIQKLHNDIYREGENTLLLSDLQKRDIIMFGDEAHHLNTETSKHTQPELFQKELTGRSSGDDIARSWETTVIHYLLNKGGKNEENRNALLEFTATIPNDAAIQKKYDDKIIAKFDLKDFVDAGYTKEINLISSSYNKKQRILQALLFNWYRYQVALNNNLDNFKPVILFRSKTIKESQTDFAEFADLINNLQNDDFKFLDNINSREGLFDDAEIYARGQSRIIELNHFINENNYTFAQIIDYIQNNFTERNCVITNSKTNNKKTEETDEDTERLLNNLEAKGNPVRAIFTVQRLTEGWDVQNLYDIVRLYSGRDERHDTKGKRIVGATTTAEVQLIGRGVRYYPFMYNGEIVRKRQFDHDISNEMRTLEEFYYHSDDDNRYISELTIELKRKGLIQDNKVEKEFKIKEEFLELVKEQKLKIGKNERVINPNRKLNGIPDRYCFTYKIKGFSLNETTISFEGDNEKTRFEKKETKKDPLIITFEDFERHIAYKAIHILAVSPSSLYYYKNLSERFEIESLDDFFLMLDNLNIEIEHSSPLKFEDIENRVKLDILLAFFRDLEKYLGQYDYPYKGSEFELKPFSDCFPAKKIMKIDLNRGDKTENNKLENELQKESWYALDSFWGTSEERELIDFIQSNLDKLREKYENVTLLRNEEVYKIYSFDNGNAFMPDFLLLLKNKDSNETEFYQVFIEPKGAHLVEHDKWKQDFLNQITDKNIILNNETSKYRIIGLPFFNKGEQKLFIEEFTKQFEKLL